MNRRSRLYRSGLLFGLGALVAAMALLAVPSQAARADTGCDCWIVTPTGANPATASAGTSVVYSFTVTNDDPNETLQQLTFTAPGDFVITGATGPTGTTLSALPASSVTLTVPSSTVSPFNVDITVLAPCTAASGTWSLSDKDSLDNNEAIWSSTPLSVSVTGQCSLAFANEPAETAAGSPITTAFRSTGDPIAVQLFDFNNKPLDKADFSASRTSVMVSIQTNPGGGTLTGNTALSSNGIADFNNLQIDKAGTGYTLVASASGFTTSAPSKPFTIDGQSQPCPSTTTCSGSASSATTSGTATTTLPAPGDFIATSIGGFGYTCNGTYQPVSDAFSFALFDAAGDPQSNTLAVSLEIHKSLVQSSGHPGASSWQICYASTSQFNAVTGTYEPMTIGGVTYNTGLLLGCTSTQGPPCVQGRHKDNAGDVIVAFLAPGDPYGRG